MVRYYAERIRAGKLLLENVPARWRGKVKETLENEKQG